MSVASRGRPPIPLDIAKQHVEQAFGPKVAKRLDTFKDGTFYVTAGDWARLFAWLVDFVLFALLALIGLGVLAVAFPDVSGDVAALTMLGLLFGVPILYGLCYGNGRALGAVLTGTRLVRHKNGQRIGAKACWAMLVRTVLFPPLLIGMVFENAVNLATLARISIDDKATKQLHAAGFLRLEVPGYEHQRLTGRAG